MAFSPKTFLALKLGLSQYSHGKLLGNYHDIVSSFKFMRLSNILSGLPMNGL